MMKKTTRNYLWVLLANVLLIGAVALIWQTRLEAATPVKPVLQGTFNFMKVKEKPMPVPQANYLKNFEKRAPLSELVGQWTVLNLWATWCAPCVTELPSLQKLSDTYAGKGLKVVAVSLDDAQNVDELREAITRARLSDIAVAKNWDDHGEISNTLWPEALPATYIISPEGKVWATFEGDADWVSPDALAFVDSLLKASPSAPAVQ